MLYGKLFRVIAASVVCVLLRPSPGWGWYEKVHACLAKAAAESIARQDGQLGLYAELYQRAPLLQVGRGAWREDYAPPVEGNSRAFRHYYDPDSTRPLKGVPYYSHYLLWPHLEAGSAVTEPAGGVYEGALRWALNGGGTGDNPFHWNGAIRAYGAGTVEGRRQAYLRLGHVLHLLGDTSEPDHASNTPHPGSGKHLPGELESFLAERVSDVMLWIRREAGRRGANQAVDLVGAFAESELRARVRSSVRKDFEQRYGGLAVSLIGLEGLVEDALDAGLVTEFFLERERAVLPPRIAGLPRLELDGGVEPQRLAGFEEYFVGLARYSKMRQAASGLPLPVGCAHLGPLVIRVAHDQAAEAWPGLNHLENFAALASPDLAAWARTELLPSLLPEILKEPLYFQPTIDEFDPASYAPHLALGEDLLRQATAAMAGLMMHFHDIVNEPPFVREVRVTQSSSRYYRGTWLEQDFVNMPAGRPAEEYRGVRNGDVPRTYRELRARTIEREPAGSVTDAARELVAGKPATIEIRFGPNLKWDDVEVGERIAPDSVKVEVDGKPVSGGLAGPSTWRGEFVPRLGPGERGRRFAVSIEARDSHAHHSRPGLPSQGYRLDARPEDSPTVEPDPPAYPWRGYTPGPDLNHSFLVAPGKDAGEAPLTTAPPAPPTGWVGTWSVTSVHTKGLAKGRPPFKWSFTVEMTGNGLVVVTKNGRFPAQVSGDVITWKSEGGGNKVDVTLTLKSDGNSFEGGFEGGHYTAKGEKNDDIAGDYTGNRVR